MVAHNGLNNCQSKPSAAQLARVIRSEQPLALVRGHTLPGVGHSYAGGMLFHASAQGQCAARGHGINGVEN